MSLLTTPPAGDPGTVTAPTDWRAKLPEDLRSAKAFESVKGANWDEAGPALAKQFLHAQSLVGADKLIMPTATSTPEEIAAFHKKLGRPDKFEEYGLKLPDGLNEAQLDKARIDEWKKEMHEAGLPKAAAERLLAKYIGNEFKANQDRDTAAQKTMEQHELSIKAEFGAKYDEKINHARYAIKEYGTTEMKALFDSTGFGSHPEVVRMFARIGEAMAVDKARNGGAQVTFGGSPEEAQAGLTAFNANPENMKALMDRSHPQHDNVVKERAKLYAAAFPPSS